MMACVTLKRPLGLEPFDSVHSPDRPPSKRRRCTPTKGFDRDSCSMIPSAQPSVFRESPLSVTEIANHLRDELRRIKRRKHLHGDEGRPGSPPDMVVDNPGHSSSRSSPRPATSDKPVFTLKQMTLICERMCKERTEKVREEYDKILQQKMSEQYDAFVKFIDHQIQARFNQSQLPSYLS